MPALSGAAASAGAAAFAAILSGSATSRHEREALLRSYGTQIAALDAAAKETAAAARKAAWESTLASTREEELRLVADALVAQLVSLTGAAHADRAALMLHAWRALTAQWRRMQAEQR